MRIVLISCVKEKVDGPVAAGDLYASTLFLEMRRYAEKFSDRWYILSAKHGLLAPQDVITRYDLTLNTLPAAERREWARRVYPQFSVVAPRGAQVEIVAGEKYFEYLLPLLEDGGYTVSLPLKGVRLFDRVPELRRLIAGST